MKFLPNNRIVLLQESNKDDDLQCPRPIRDKIFRTQKHQHGNHANTSVQSKNKNTTTPSPVVVFKPAVIESEGKGTVARTPSRRRVHFRVRVRVRATLSRQDFTVEESRQYWYTHWELVSIQRQAARFVKSYHRKKQFQDYTKDLQWNNTSRGMEFANREYKKTYLHRYTMARHTVLNPNKIPNASNSMNRNHGTTSTAEYITASTELSKRYHACTYCCQQEAYERARIDMRVAQNMYKLIHD